MNRLMGKSAIVTGASSGIGWEAAKLFAAHGGSVVACARRPDKLEILVDEIRREGGRAIAVAGDIKDERHVAEAVKVAETEFGGLDVAFNNAGSLGEVGDICALSEADWLDVLNTNLTSAFLCVKHQIPAMLKRGAGSVIFTSSFVGGDVGFPGMAAYGASKAGLSGLTNVLAAEYGGKNIRFNLLIPGGTDTPMSESFTSSPDSLEFVKSLHALKRIAQPKEVAHVALFLASDEASFVTGSSVHADGGVSICKA